jgi:hypothetical protein
MSLLPTHSHWNLNDIKQLKYKVFFQNIVMPFNVPNLWFFHSLESQIYFKIKITVFIQNIFLYLTFPKKLLWSFFKIAMV